MLRAGKRSQKGSIMGQWELLLERKAELNDEDPGGHFAHRGSCQAERIITPRQIFPETFP